MPGEEEEGEIVGNEEPTCLPRDVEGSVMRQVEHYFSDENLAKDAFLRSKMNENNHVPIALIAGFPRIKALRPRGVSEGEWLKMFAQSIKKNSASLAVDTSKMTMGRKAAALPELGNSAGQKRPRSTEINIGSGERDPESCIFVGGLADEVTEVLLYELFTQVGPVQRVTMPRSVQEPDKHKGFAFVQFDDGPVNSAEHSVSYAIRVMQDVRLFDRYLSVKRSNSGTTRPLSEPATRPVMPGEYVELPQ